STVSKQGHTEVLARKERKKMESNREALFAEIDRLKDRFSAHDLAAIVSLVEEYDRCKDVPQALKIEKALVCLLEKYAEEK
ncbi:MAG TPA: hypothetical protein P5560_08410, partial [Thermotogota bacterium]|nr:hypothetical protein [Thermotogota bacterium]HRW92950.1 hypothetical protein [Thermotogota bacterium]